MKAWSGWRGKSLTKIEADIDKDLQASGVHDMTAKFGSRLVKKDRCAYLRPTVILCDSPEPAIAPACPTALVSFDFQRPTTQATTGLPNSRPRS